MQQTITRRISQRTYGRIQLLEVEVKGDTIVVRGRSPSYHIKQLALRAILDALAVKGLTQFEHNIEVDDCPERCEADKPASPRSTSEVPSPYIPLPEPIGTSSDPRVGALRVAQAPVGQAEACARGVPATRTFRGQPPGAKCRT